MRFFICVRAIIVRGRGGPWLIFCWSWELFIGECVWWFLFEEYELGYFCECFDIERSRPTYNDWDYYDVGIYGAVG